MNNKILLFSDLHIQNPKKNCQRLDDCLKILDWVVEVAKNNDIEDIIFLGDLFHDRKNIAIDVYNKTFEKLYELFNGNNKQKLTLLIGNHDLLFYEKPDISSIYPFQPIKNIEIVKYPCLKKFGQNEISFLPFTSNPIEVLKSVPKSNILCAHIAIDGAVLNNLYNTISEVAIEFDDEIVKVNENIFTEWEQVFLGHYHGSQKIGLNMEYVGSPLQLSFGEAFQEKHIIIYDFETKIKEYIINDFSPKYLIISEDNVNEYDLNNNYIRVDIKNSSKTDILDLQKKIITDNNILSLKFDFSKENRKQTAMILQDVKKSLTKGSDVVEQYIEEVGCQGLDIDKIKETFNKIKARRENVQ